MAGYIQVAYYKEDGYWRYAIRHKYPGFCNITSFPGDRFRTKENAMKAYQKEKLEDMPMRKIMLDKVREKKNEEIHNTNWT